MSRSRAPLAPNANGRKRPIDTIDLTGGSDDEAYERAPKASKSSQTNVINYSQPTQSQRDSWLEENDANETIILSQEGGNDAEAEEFELYGLDNIFGAKASDVKLNK